MLKDRQLRGIRLRDALEKRRLDQPLNAKEFAVLTAISYSTARAWFKLPGFPAFRGMVFWQDFVQWRNRQNGLDANSPKQPFKSEAVRPEQANRPEAQLPARVAQILQDANLLTEIPG